MEGDFAYRVAYQETAKTLRSRLQDGSCRVHETCDGLTFLNCGMEFDGPAYYVDTATFAILEVCGGACMAGPGAEVCVACPPPEWSCGK